MRCPKCGYISFDHLEACKKCHSNLSAVTGEINGTTYHVTAPKFLQITTGVESGPLNPVSRPQVVAREAQMFAEKTLATSDPADFSLDFELEDDHDMAIAQVKDEPGLQLHTGMADITPEGEIDFALEQLDKSDEAGPDITLDFGDLDISDLAPPTMEPTGAPIHFAPQSTFSDDEDDVAPAPSHQTPPASIAASEGSANGLEDLQFNGLDLDSPAKLVTGSAAGKRFLPSVKTGTALDKFDIDLGELFDDGKGENAKNY